ncbi:hypothetical protein V1505DRAFT_409182 [Lipomyces doorenjongii]
MRYIAMILGPRFNNAVKLGLHCPGKTQDFGRVKVKTWVTCNIVSQHLSMALGCPTFSMYDWTVNNSYRREGFISMPQDLRVQVKLAKFCDRMVHFLIKTRVTSAETLRLTSDICKLLILVTRTQLYAYAFLDEDGESNLDGLTLAYQSAIQMKAFTETLDVSIIPDGKYSKLLYLPTYVELGIVLAAFIIMKLQISSLCETLDVTSDFASASAILQKSSIKDNDFPICVSTTMFQLWKLHSKDKLDAIRDAASAATARTASPVV